MDHYKYLIDIIEREMESDDQDRLVQSIRLIATYDSASPDEQQLIDRILICLCGWGMETLKTLAKEQA